MRTLTLFAVLSGLPRRWRWQPSMRWRPTLRIAQTTHCADSGGRRRRRSQPGGEASNEPAKKPEEKKDAAPMGRCGEHHSRREPTPRRRSWCQARRSTTRTSPSTSSRRSASRTRASTSSCSTRGVQVNGKFTQHLGRGLRYVYHLQENFGFQVSATTTGLRRVGASTGS